MQTPLQPAVAAWLEKIKLALDFKAKRFGKDAEEGMRFLGGTVDWLYGPGRHKDRHFREAEGDDGDNEIPAPRFQMSVNKTAEMVQIFGPVLYHKNPVRQVNPRTQPELPASLIQQAMQSGDQQTLMQFQQLAVQSDLQRGVDEARAGLLAHYLNYTPTALDLKTESRWAIDETLIKGMGLLWQEPYRPPAGGTAMVGSFYDSVDNLAIDPDMPSLRHSKWVARRRCEHVWEAERKFNLPPGTLKPAVESVNQQAEVNANPNGSFLRESGQTADLVVYWEVFSKCGLGGRLKGVADWSTAPLEQFGDHCYVVVAKGIPYPLNVPEALWDLPEGQAADAITQAVQWPTPYWADGAWPFTPISFHDIPGDPWPMSHLSPAMGELKFLNWVYSFIAGKIRITCRDFVAIKASAGEEIKTAVTSGSDYELIEINSSHGTIDEVVKFLQHPQFNGDIWRVIEYVAEQFDRRTGLTELMYGVSSSQLRSATEADIKSNQMSVRPDDMANKVEDAMSVAARQEAFCARWHLTSQDVAPVMGPVGASLWESFVVPSDPAEILYQLEYRIEAGSARKPNKQRDAENIQNAMQQLMPFFQQIAIQGMVDPFNALVTVWAKAMDMDPTPLVLPQPPAMMPPQPQPTGAPTGG